MGGERVGLLCPRPILREELRPYGPQSLSGRSLVFKEMAFRPADGSTIKSPWERHFLEESTAEAGEHPCLVDDPFWEELPGHWVEGTPRIVERDASGGYRMDCHNGLSLACRHLYWMLSPRELAECYSGVLATQDSPPGSLYVRYSFAGVVTDRTETLFFPLSYTHTQGHFVGVFQKPQEGRQEIEFVTFLDMEETQEEDISKKIRVLDRRLAKAFDNFKKIPHQKSIRITSHSPLPVPATVTQSAPEGLHFS